LVLGTAVFHSLLLVIASGTNGRGLRNISAKGEGAVFGSSEDLRRFGVDLNGEKALTPRPGAATSFKAVSNDATLGRRPSGHCTIFRHFCERLDVGRDVSVNSSSVISSTISKPDSLLLLLVLLSSSRLASKAAAASAAAVGKVLARSMANVPEVLELCSKGRSNKSSLKVLCKSSAVLGPPLAQSTGRLARRPNKAFSFTACDAALEFCAAGRSCGPSGRKTALDFSNLLFRSWAIFSKRARSLGCCFRMA